jgi:phosphoribosylglycinamide formyltransferase-1
MDQQPTYGRKSMKHIVVFASGNGSNAMNLIHHFSTGNKARVVAVFCNNPEAGIIEKAKAAGVPVVLFNRAQFSEAGVFDAQLAAFQPDIIALAGFLWLFPSRLVQQYANRIVNIHPALLPAYGGKGMYGDHVHRAVLANKETRHGVSVHLVNEHYDEGHILLQESFEIAPDDTLETVKQRIHEIEDRLFPAALEQLL